MSEYLFGPSQPQIAERFEDHVITLTLAAGEANGLVIKVECKAGDKEHSVCDPKFCQLDDLIKMVGWPDCVKAAGDIELARLSARVDWRDPEEPWVEVEP